MNHNSGIFYPSNQTFRVAIFIFNYLSKAKMTTHIWAKSARSKLQLTWQRFMALNQHLLEKFSNPKPTINVGTFREYNWSWSIQIGIMYKHDKSSIYILPQLEKPIAIFTSKGPHPKRITLEKANQTHPTANQWNSSRLNFKRVFSFYWIL